MRNKTDPEKVSLFDSTQYGSAAESERERVRLRLVHSYDNIVSLDNLLVSWQEFLRGKRKRKDVAEFILNFSDNLLMLHNKLINKTYKHGGYQAFKITDPKPRDIHKAKIEDRIVHHAIYRILYPYFDKKFIFDSYSCRRNKGTHKAINRLGVFGRKVSKNNIRTTWVLKCDIKKFFANINHKILIEILEKYIGDQDLLWLLDEIIKSFSTEGNLGIGIPLGNLTSQLLVNIYMNEFDQFVKRKLKVKYYIRYADDFLVLSENKQYLEGLIPKFSEFLEKELKLSLNLDKLFIKTLASGIDFLGWISFPYYRILRTSTKRRMLRRLSKNKSKGTLNSYLGLLSH